jgi:hypothetical protein
MRSVWDASFVGMTNSMKEALSVIWHYEVFMRSVWDASFVGMTNSMKLFW